MIMKKDVDRIDLLLKRIEIPDAYKHMGSIHLIKKTRQAFRV